MSIQYIIVAAIIFAAILYAGAVLRKRSHSFSMKKECGGDCGCNGTSKDLNS